MKQQSKFSQGQQHSESQSAQEAQEQRQSAQEFANAEELLRFDAAQTTVPPEIADRLKQSTKDMPVPPRRSWWKNLFGK